MKIDVTKAPSVFGGNTRTAVSVGLSDLKDAGVAFTSYGLKEGETVEFPESEAEYQCKKQPVRVGSNAVQYLLLVKRGMDPKNLKEDWFALGSIARADINGKGIDEEADKIIALGNHEDRVKFLFGKTLKAGSKATIQVQKFVDGVMGERGETMDATVVKYKIA